MIQKPTVLILGAGASCPYGFPTGRQLRDNICAPANWSFLVRAPYDKFLKSLQKSGFPSVDKFLENNPQFIDTGRYLIASHLIECERPSKLLPPKAPKIHWYEFLVNQLLSGGKRNFHRNKLTIITFNYDRSLEHYLATVISERFREAYSVSLKRIFKTIKVLHVHGQLGRLASGPRARSYSTDSSDKNVRLAARSIKIIHVANPNSDSFGKAKASLKRAARIYFLGFGYDSTNMERLGFRKGPKPRYSGQVFLGSYGLNGTMRKKLIDDYRLKEIDTAAQPSRSIGYVVRDLPWD